MKQQSLIMHIFLPKISLNATYFLKLMINNFVALKTTRHLKSNN
jgi:hypothetical protein